MVLGTTPEAAEVLERLVKVDPKNADGQYLLGQCLLHQQSLNNFALEAANARNWPQAVAQLQEALQVCGQCTQLPILHRNLGLIYARKGETGPAKRELRLALEINPQDADASTALGILERLPSAETSAK